MFYFIFQNFTWFIIIKVLKYWFYTGAFLLFFEQDFYCCKKNYFLNENVDSFVSFPIIHVSGLIKSLWKITLISLSVDYCIIAISSCAKCFSILYFLLFFLFLNFVNFFFQFITLIFALITLFIVTSSNFLKPWHQASRFWAWVKHNFVE